MEKEISTIKNMGFVYQEDTVRTIEQVVQQSDTEGESARIVNASLTLKKALEENGRGI